MPKLLLINPAPRWKLSAGREELENILHAQPLGLTYVAALTPPHWEVQIVDENLGAFTFQEEADLVGLTAMTNTAPRAYEISQALQAKGIPTVMGGIHASFVPDEAQEYCTSVVIGEAESVWKKVLEDFENGQLKPVYKGEWLTLEGEPIPRRDLLSPRYPLDMVVASRGCPMNCDFCACTAFHGPKLRQRPIDEIIEEFKTLTKRHVRIVAENILGFGRESNAWAYELFSKIGELGIRKSILCQASLNVADDAALLECMANAGVTLLHVGIESPSDESLKSLGKPLNVKIGAANIPEKIRTIQNSGIGVFGNFMYGSDADDISVLSQIEKFIIDNNVDVVEVCNVTPFPGTRLYERLKEEGRIVYDNYPEDWERYTFLGSEFVFKTAKVESSELRSKYIEFMQRYYSRRRTFLRTIRTLRRTKNLRTTIVCNIFNRGSKRILTKGSMIKERYQEDNKSIL